MVEDKATLLTVVALALIDSAGDVLVQQRPAHKAHGGLWEFPGGKVEAGEGLCTALIREIEEELGLTLAEGDLFPINFAARGPADGERPLVLLLYGCRHWQGTPSCEPGAALAWTAVAELAGLAMPPLDVPLATALLRHAETGVK